MARPRFVNRLVNPHHSVDDATLRRAVEGRVVVVTGASHGIGRAVATRLCGAGAEVVMVARSAELLDEIAAELGSHAHALVCDLTDEADVARLVTAIGERFGQVDVVVSNAGKSIRRSLADSYERMHDFTRTMGVNYLGPVQLLLGLLPAMRARGSGHIVNVSTMGVLIPPAPEWSAYLSSKAAFDVWLRSAATEIADDGVTVSSIYMGLVHTRMSAPGDFEGVPGLKPDQAADVVCHAIVEHPRVVAPWWARAAGAFGSVARGPSEGLARRYGRRIGGNSG